MKTSLKFTLALALVVVRAGGDVVSRFEFPDKPFDLRALIDPRLEAAYIPTAIKSIQANSCDVNGVTSKATTITSVVTGNALIFHEGSNAASGSNQATFMQTRVDLTNATTVTCTIGTGPGTTFPVKFEVLEFRPGVLKSVQRGTVPLNTGTSATATISSVNTAKAFLSFPGSVNSDAVNVYNLNFVPAIALTNATTVTATVGGADASAATYNVGYQVAEFF